MFIQPSMAVEHAVALLIVACPCALGLATPLALTAAIGRSARRGILIKGGDAVERLGVGTHGQHVMYLDKTGTLTQGVLAVVEWRGDADALRLAGVLEATSSHPVARAIADYAGAAPEHIATSVTQTTGAGIEGIIAGHRVVVGSPAFVSGVIAGSMPSVEALVERALTPVLVAVDGECRGVFGLGDPIRPEAAAAIRELVDRGWNVGILSGDHPRVAEVVGRELGIEPAMIRGGLSPEDKLRIVSTANVPSSTSTVVMVGDGVNDAAALAAADVGIAVHGGAEASMAAADVYISKPGLSPILSLLTASRRTRRAIRVCLAASLFYNVVAVSLAVAGMITPLLAALFMPISSLTVLAIAFRVRTYDEGGVH
jgi:Cu2+-exporting ATPase